MLQIEVDVTSGRPNPQWILVDTRRTEELLNESTIGNVDTPSDDRGAPAVEARASAYGDRCSRQRHFGRTKLMDVREGELSSRAPVVDLGFDRRPEPQRPHRPHRAHRAHTCITMQGRVSQR
jgi:hypothetical protein